MIKTINLSYFYKSQEKKINALKNINLKFNPEEFTVVLGKNGSGKSTLLKCLAGIEKDYDGEILINGINIKEYQDIKENRGKIGFIFENPETQLISPIVREDIAFGPENLNLSLSEIEERIEYSQKLLKIEKLSHRDIHKISAGEKQKVALAGILALKPDILISDEATSYLDISNRESLIGLFMELKKNNGKTVIHATHFPNESIFADRVIVLDEGEVVYQGSPEELYLNPTFVDKLGIRVPYVFGLINELKKKNIILKKGIKDIEGLVESLC